MNLKHIVIFSRSLPFHGIGGMEVVAWDLAHAFKNRGLKVTCITTSLENRSEITEIDGIEVIALKNTPSGKYSSAWFQHSTQYFMNHYLEKGVAVLSVSAAAAELMKQNKNLKSIPIIFQAHGTSIGEISSKLRTLKIKAILSSLRNFIWFFKDMTLYQKCDAIVAVGDKVYKDLTTFPNTIGAQRSKVHLIRNGIDVDLFSFNLQKRKNLRSKLHINRNEKVIISASRLHKQKGVHLGLLGFAKYLQTNPNTTYIIIGNGPENENLKQLSAQLGITEKVIFTGSLNRNVLADYLNVGDLFLFTTLRDEGLPLNALEALSCGLKVIISSHIEGITKISQEAVIPVDPKSSDAVAKALLTAVDEDRSSYLPDEYSLKYCADEYIKLFHNILQRNDIEKM